MYTNIDMSHPLKKLLPFLSTSSLYVGCLANALKITLEILMRQNMFKLCDAFWKQNADTAIGTPPGANYANFTTAPGKLS
jgi:hypothetical protein